MGTILESAAPVLEVEKFLQQLSRQLVRAVVEGAVLVAQPGKSCSPEYLPEAARTAWAGLAMSWTCR